MSDSNATELLPCPFCGCANIDEYEGDYGNGVYCMNCGAMMGEPIHMEYRVTERVSMEQAVEAWNTRTPEQAVDATLGAGECELVETDSYSNENEVIHVLECSNCGETCEHVNGSYPRCPHCGRKAVKR